MYAISGKDGRLIWQWELFDSLNFELGDINAIDASRDFNGDGTVDVLATSSATNSAGTQGRRALYCLNGRTGQVLWQLPLNTFVDGTIATRHGGVVTTNSQTDANNIIYGFDTTGALRWNYNNNRPVWEMATFMLGNSETVLLAEGTSTFASVSLKALNAQTGTLLWTGATSSGFYTDVKTIGDVNQDGTPDVIAAGAYSAFVVSGATGATLWEQPLGSITLGVEEMRKGDRRFGNVAQTAVAFATLDNRVLIYDAPTGNLLFTFNTGTGANSTAAVRVSILDDITRDMTVDFLVASRDGRLWCLSGGEGSLGIKDQNTIKLLDFLLEQNYPNPFNPSTQIRYQLARASEVRLELFDVLGRKIATLLNTRQEQGVHVYRLDASELGLASGVYFYRLQAGEFSATRKMLLLK